MGTWHSAFVIARPPKKRNARAGLALIDPESLGVYLTLREDCFSSNEVDTDNAMWIVLVLHPDEREDMPWLEQTGELTSVHLSWIEHYAEDP